MLSLPLMVPDVSELLAVHYLDRGAPAAQYRSMEWGAAAASRGTGDILAWALVAFFLLSVGVLAGCIIALRGRPARPSPEQLLIEEVQENEDALARGDSSGERESWEKDPDWWRKERGD